MTKQEIRNQFLKLRQALPDAEYHQLSQDLCTIFFSKIDLSTTNTLHVFLPITTKKEPDTWLIIDRLTTDFPKIRISIPKMKDENTLINFYFEGRTQIKESKWKIPEPHFGKITPIECIDLVIVPLLAFDLKGNRVGYGKGYYDRFLKECRRDCKKVGLSFFNPANEISGIDHHDLTLTSCITPTEFYSF